MRWRKHTTGSLLEIHQRDGLFSRAQLQRWGLVECLGPGGTRRDQPADLVDVDALRGHLGQHPPGGAQELHAGADWNDSRSPSPGPSIA